MNGAVSKTVVQATVPWVRIPPPPPFILLYLGVRKVHACLLPSILFLMTAKKLAQYLGINVDRSAHEKKLHNVDKNVILH